MFTVYFLLILLLIYFLSLLLYIIGNFKNNPLLKKNSLEPVSVIVAVKNGASSLLNILNDLKNQDYNGNVEYIIVDDESTDDSKKIIKKFSEKNTRFRYISSNEGNPKLFFKKKALDAGIKNAHFNILLFTDVDCRLKNTWVSSMAQLFNKNVDYVIGVSKIDYQNNIISWFQKIDLRMLFCVARGMCNLGIPFASIGQNQAYKKDVYKKIGFLDLENSIQGDDTLFLQLCVKKNVQVIFNDDPKSFVNSRIEKKIWPFIKQRVRWAADLKVMWNYNKLLFIISLSTFMTNSLILLMILDLFFLKIYNYSQILYLIIFMKMILELIVYAIGNFKLGFKTSLVSFLYWFVLEIPYVVFMSFGSFFVQLIGWKGQKK